MNTQASQEAWKLEILIVWYHFKEVMVASLVTMVTHNSTQQCGGRWPALETYHTASTTQFFSQATFKEKIERGLLESHLETPVRGPKQNA